MDAVDIMGAVDSTNIMGTMRTMDHKDIVGTVDTVDSMRYMNPSA